MVLTQPFAFNSLRQDLNRLFYSAPVAHPGFAASHYATAGLPQAAWQPVGAQTIHFVPRSNWAETPEGTVITVELPGVELSQLSLRLEGACLVLEGIRHPGGLIGDRMVSYHAAEGRFGAFRWVCQIPNGTVLSQIEAVSRNGLLTIVLPRMAAPVGVAPLAVPAMAQAPSAQIMVTPGVTA